MDADAFLRSLDEDALVELVEELAAKHPDVARDLAERAAAVATESRSVWDRQAFGALRGAVYRRDAQAAIQAIAGKPLEPVLQLAGDAILVALAADVPDATALAERCLELLRERDAEGDEELAAQLAAKTEGAPAPLLRELPVDLEMLADLIEGNGYQEMYIDLETGDIGADESYTGVPMPDEDNMLVIGAQIGSRAGYADMADFTVSVRDKQVRDRLERALEGKGAFRRFRDEIHRTPGETTEQWYLFSEERRRGRARAWLAHHGIRPRP